MSIGRRWRPAVPLLCIASVSGRYASIPPTFYGADIRASRSCFPLENWRKTKFRWDGLRLSIPVNRRPQRNELQEAAECNLYNRSSRSKN